MSERSLTIWNLLLGLTIVSILGTTFKLVPMNKKYTRVKTRSADLQFGTDKELENIIGYLEKRLEERSEFQFDLENSPMMLTNVLTLADGTGRKTRRNRNAIRVAMIFQRDNNFQAQIDYRGQPFTVGVGDTIPDIGFIELIDEVQVLIQTDNGIKSYAAPGNEITSFNGENGHIIILSTKKNRSSKKEKSIFLATE